MKKVYSSLIATTAMTLFSYLFSWAISSNLKEPHILAQLTSRLMPWRNKYKNRVTGWLLHYAVGLLFTEMYIQFSKKSFSGCTKKDGLIYGGLAGLAAILIWRFSLKIHPFPPAINFSLFSLNLFLCHLLFGFISAVTYRPHACGVKLKAACVRRRALSVRS